MSRDDPGGHPADAGPQTIHRLLTVVDAAFLILGAGTISRRNLRLGRGDRGGTLRVALFVFTFLMLRWVLGREKACRDWTVRMPQDRLPARASGFESRLRHQQPRRSLRRISMEAAPTPSGSLPE